MCNPIPTCSNSVLETFYIAPNEHLYVWDKTTVERIAQICEAQQIAMPPNEFFEKLRIAKSDTAHRGGLSPEWSKDAICRTESLRQTERLLTNTLCWGILHQKLIADAFDDDRWPL